MRIFAATLGTETNTFSPIPTGLKQFHDTLYFPAGTHPDRMLMFSTPLCVARARVKTDGHQLFEGLCAFAQPAGICVRSAYETLRDTLLDDLRRAMPVDVVLMGLHGAMVADGYDDCEGDLLARVREIVGPDAVIGAEMDPHCNLSPTKVAAADILVCFKEYPHIDFVERAEELYDLCIAAAAKRIKPTKAVFDCRMIAILHTPAEPMRGFVDKIKAMEGQGGILHVSIAHSFPWGDVADMGTKILVTTDNDPALAARVAETLGRELIGFRGRTAPQYLTIDAALDQAASHNQSPVTIADSADNPGGGAPADATFMLARVLDRKLSGVVLAPLFDPQAVSLCFEVGEGARLPLRIGGKTAAVSGDPIDVTAEVVSLKRDARQSFGAGEAVMGDSARIRILEPGSGDTEIVLISNRCQATGLELITQFGIDPADCRTLILKSSQHFHAAFAPVSAAVLYVGGPGAIAADLTQFDYRKIQRPKWPFDLDPWGERP